MYFLFAAHPVNIGPKQKAKCQTDLQVFPAKNHRVFITYSQGLLNKGIVVAQGTVDTTYIKNPSGIAILMYNNDESSTFVVERGHVVARMEIIKADENTDVQRVDDDVITFDLD